MPQEEWKRSWAERGGEGAGDECGEEVSECECEDSGEECRDTVGLSVGVMGGEDSGVDVDEVWRCSACPSIDCVSIMAGGGEGWLDGGGRARGSE